MNTESNIVLKTFRGLGLARQQSPTKVVQEQVHPSEETAASTQPNVQEQIAFYRDCMAQEAYLRYSAVPATQAEMSAYEAEASKIHLVEGREVNIFAPFATETSALKTITRGQVAVLALLGIGLVASLLVNLGATLAALMAIIIAFYFGNLIVTFWLSVHTLEETSGLHIADEVVHALTDVDWPRYTILCPLYRETEVVAQFSKAMQALDYPKDKLQILFLTEADDEETRDAIRAARLPSNFQIITVPDGQPRTKPRACNYGLIHSTGDFVVIYDAEDIPDTLQLKKAALVFASQGPELGCVQAKLNFYNTNQNILTRWFTVEYSTWFDTTLPGLQWGRFSLPLGGTSNHFRTSTLRQLGAWDAFNVTEDCDLGLRLSTRGMRTLVLDSTTYEEANPRVRNWIRQRSRWIKGYMQTYLIHMRQPWRYLKPAHWREFISLQVIIGGRTAVLLVNPVMWVMTTIFFLVWPHLEEAYRSLFPAIVLYTAVICLIFGNLAYIYTHFVGCLKRRQYGLVKWTLLMPVYWAMTSYAAFKAFHQLITKPHYWEKTTHGLHLNHPAMTGASSEPLSAEETQMAEQISDPEPVAVPASAAVLTAESNGHSHSDTATRLKRHIHARENGYVHSNGSGNGYRSNGAKAAVEQPRRFQFLTKDRWLIATIIMAVVASIVATLYFFQTRQILLYNDAFSHLAIARRIFDNTTPGLAQLGGVWLPLPHLLMIPFASFEDLWRTGLAGAFTSMPCYIATAIYLYLAARRLTRNSLASFVGTLVFILNPNILYLQATPLSETVAGLTVVASGYYLVLWLQDDRPMRLLLLAAAIFLATLTRYEGWALFMGFLALIPFVTLLKRESRHRIEANAIFYGLLAGTGILLWISWCWIIFHDPLYFQRSEYSAQAQQDAIRAQVGLLTYRDLHESLRTMAALSAVTLGPALLILSAIGLGVYLLQKRFSLDSLAALAFLIPPAFYILTLYTGQTVIYLPGLVSPISPHQFFNNRYGVIVVPPAAIFTALYVASLSGLREQVSKLRLPTSELRKLPAAAFALIIVVQSVIIAGTGVVVLQDGQFGLSCAPPQAITDYLARYYDGRKLLVDTFYAGGWNLGPLAGVEIKNMIYEGSGVYWQRALRDPSSAADWIILFPGTGDKVAENINTDSPRFRLEYSLVVREDNGRSLYRRNGLPAPPERPAGREDILDNSRCPN